MKRNKLRYPTEEDARKYKEWVQAIRKRDSDCCILCKGSERTQVHHIQTWQNAAELRFSVDNGVLLCWSCHKQTFKQEEQYEFIFKNYILSLKNNPSKALPDYDVYLKMKYGEKNA